MMEARNCFALRYDAGANTSVEVQMEGGVVALSVPNVHPVGQGGILQVNVRVKDVLPERKLALGLMLYEDEQLLGIQTLLLPAHHEKESMDVLVERITFVLPEAKRARKLCLETAAHYIDKS